MPATPTADAADRQRLFDFLVKRIPAGEPSAKALLEDLGAECVILAETWRRSESAKFLALRGQMARIREAAQAAGVEVPPRWGELVPSGADAGRILHFVQPEPHEVSLAPGAPPAGGGPAPDPRLVYKVRADETLQVTMNVKSGAGGTLTLLRSVGPLEVGTAEAGTELAWDLKDAGGAWVTVDKAPLLFEFTGAAPVVRQIDTIKPWFDMAWGEVPGDDDGGPRHCYAGVIARTGARVVIEGTKVPAKIQTRGLAPATTVVFDVVQAIAGERECVVTPRPAGLTDVRLQADGTFKTAAGAIPEVMIPAHPGLFDSPYHYLRASVTVPGATEPQKHDSPRTQERLLRITYEVGIIANPDGTLTNAAVAEATGIYSSVNGSPLYDPFFLQRSTIESGVKVPAKQPPRMIVGGTPKELAKVPGTTRTINCQDVTNAAEGTFIFIYSGHGSARCLVCEAAHRSGEINSESKPIPPEGYTVKSEPPLGDVVVEIRDPEARRWGARVTATFWKRDPLVSRDDDVLEVVGEVAIGATLPIDVEVAAPASFASYKGIKVEFMSNSFLGCARCGQKNREEFMGNWAVAPGMTIDDATVRLLSAPPAVVGMSCCYAGINRRFADTFFSRSEHTRFVWAFELPVWANDATAFTRAVVDRFKLYGYKMDRFRQAYNEALSRDPRFARMIPHLFERGVA